MTTSGSKAAATGLALTLVSVGLGVSSADGFALLLGFVGVLVGTILIVAGVRVADDPTAAIGCPGALAAGVRVVRETVRCLRRNLAVVGLLLASTAASATAAAAADAAPVFCFSAFALLLLGLSLLNIGVVLLGQQEQ